MSLKRVVLMNDLQAIAYAVHHLQPDEVEILNADRPSAEPPAETHNKREKADAGRAPAARRWPTFPEKPAGRIIDLTA